MAKEDEESSENEGRMEIDEDKVDSADEAAEDKEEDKEDKARIY